MRRMCLTIVYLVVIGLPITAAGEPEWTADSVWKPASDRKNDDSISLRDLAGGIQRAFQWIGSYREVQRPAWPSLSPNQVTVYPSNPPLIVGNDMKK